MFQIYSIPIVFFAKLPKLALNASLPPAKLGQGNIFSSVCQEFCTWGVCPIACWDTPWQGDSPSLARETPPHHHSACWEIRATSGRYESYWNAYLFMKAVGQFSPQPPPPPPHPPPPTRCLGHASFIENMKLFFFSLKKLIACDHE